MASSDTPLHTIVTVGGEKGGGDGNSSSDEDKIPLSDSFTEKEKNKGSPHVTLRTAISEDVGAPQESIIAEESEDSYSDEEDSDYEDDEDVVPTRNVNEGIFDVDEEDEEGDARQPVQRTVTIKPLSWADAKLARDRIGTSVREMSFRNPRAARMSQRALTRSGRPPSATDARPSSPGASAPSNTPAAASPLAKSTHAGELPKGPKADDPRIPSTFNLFLRGLVPERLSMHNIWWAIVFAGNIVLLRYWFGGVINTLPAAYYAVYHLLMTVLVRSEPPIILLHHIVVYIPFWKYFFNRMLHCIGGLHTSSAIMTVVWLVISAATDKPDSNSTPIYVAAMVIQYLILIMVVIIISTAIPVVRRKYHDLFENFHRFMGWTSLGLLIAHVVLLYYSGKDLPVFYHIFILVGAVVFIVILPWIWVRKKEVRLSQPSTNLTVASMNGVFPTYGRVARVSFDGKEWHAFAIALCRPDINEHSLVIARAGDWTNRLSDMTAQATGKAKNKGGEGGDKGGEKKGDGKAPEKQLEHKPSQKYPNKLVMRWWVRGMKGIGFMYCIHAYRCVLLVCTGSGIAPALPYITNPLPTTFTHILWIAKNHRQVFGNHICGLVDHLDAIPHLNEPKLKDSVKGGVPVNPLMGSRLRTSVAVGGSSSNPLRQGRSVIYHDTALHGRPDEALVERVYYETQAQAVFVVSNEPFTEKLVNALFKKAIPCYGALFDS